MSWLLSPSSASRMTANESRKASMRSPVLGSGPRSTPSTRHPVWCRQSKVSFVRGPDPATWRACAPACRSSGEGLLPFSGECPPERRRCQTRRRSAEDRSIASTTRCGHRHCRSMSVMIRSKYLPAVSATMVLLLATLVPTPIRGAEPPLASASPGPGASAQRPATRADAVALVLATDPRFADLHDWEALRLRSASEFKPHILIESYYRVLPTTGTDLASWEIVERVSGSWLIAVTLVKDCVEPLSDSAPMAADPCGW